MFKKIIGMLPFLILLTGKVHADLQEDIDKAAYILSELQIPKEIIKNAKGIATMSTLKGGFIFSGKVGSGLVIARHGKKWSAPSAIGMGGAGWGLQAGVEVTDFILILNTQEALDAFSGGGSVTLGGNLSIAAGPIGGSAEGSIMMPPAAVYSYGHSSGAFAGISLEGAVIVEKPETNYEFYGEHLTPSKILSGKIEPPETASHLYEKLNF
jgi:SH3 domain-containing YSC84-like protein 1